MVQVPQFHFIIVQFEGTDTFSGKPRPMFPTGFSDVLQPLLTSAEVHSHLVRIVLLADLKFIGLGPASFAALKAGPRARASQGASRGGAERSGP